MLDILDDSRPIQNYSLRVSVLENCQYQCPYCLPGSVKPFAHKPNWLKPNEYASIAQALALYPINKIRFTGGEPLLRPDLCDIISAFHEAFRLVPLSVTTNGQLLHKKIDALLTSGLSKINLHIDTLDPVKYKRVMGNGDLAAILALLPEVKKRVQELKINVVLQKRVNDEELASFIEFSAQNQIEVRFIELMNTGSARQYVSQHFLKGSDAIEIIKRSFHVQKIPRRHPSDPAALFEIPNLKVRFGLIASDTEPFCSDCNRLRLNAEGSLRGCLYAPSGISLATLIRGGVSSEQLKKTIDMAVAGKRSFHPLLAGSEHAFSMAEIGG